MDSFCSALLDRGLVSLDVLDVVLARQLLHGGDAATNILALGFLKENALQRLLADHHEMPAGPKGQLSAPPVDVVALLSKDKLRRLRVFPYKRTSRALHLAVDEPLSAEAEQELRAVVELQLRPTLVTTLRLVEALWRHCDAEPPRLMANVIETLEEQGRKPLLAPAGIYRRMSEAPDGVRVSHQQPGGKVLQPLSEPVRSEAPSPDSQGMWLDRFVQAQGRRETVELPPNSSTTVPPSVPPGLLATAASASSPSTVNRPFTVTIPAVGIEGHGDAASLADSSRDDALAPFGPSVPPPPLFRHRGPLDVATAVSFLHECDDVELVLRVVARFARQYFERLLVFAVQGEAAEVRLAHGVGSPAPRLLLDLTVPSMFRRASAAGSPVLGLLSGQGADAAVRDALGSGLPPRTAAVIPMAIRGRIIVLVYVDDLEDAVTAESVAAVHAFCETAATEMARIVVSRKRQ